MPKPANTDIEQRLFDAYNSGATYAELTVQFKDELQNPTRSVISGLIYRFRARNGIAVKNERNSNSAKRKVPQRARPEKVVRRVIRPKPERLPPRETFPVPQDNFKPTRPLTMIYLKEDHCRYIIGESPSHEPLFCCEPIDRRSFCAHHRAICFVPPQPRKPTKKAAPVDSRPPPNDLSL